MLYTLKRLAAAACMTAILLAEQASAGNAQSASCLGGLSLKFSNTGQAGSWRSSVSVPPGGKVFVQVLYDNRGSVPFRDASIYSNLPSGFSLVQGTTQTCLTPSANETICNSTRGQGGPIDEGQVWANNSCLTIAPDAGLFDTLPSARSGLLDIGKIAFLNLVKCSYINTRNGNTDNIFAFAPGNKVRSQSLCGPGTSAIPLRSANSGVYPTNIVGRSYVNMQVCDYINYAVNGGNTDEVIGTAPANLPLFLSCGNFSNPSIQLRPEHSSVETAYHRGYRYLQFLDGQYENLSTGNTDDALKLTAAQSPLLGMPFGEGQGNIRLSRERSLVQNIDLLDRSRGKGFVQFQIRAPITPRRYVMRATLSTSSDSTVREGAGSITVSRRGQNSCSSCRQ